MSEVLTYRTDGDAFVIEPKQAGPIVIESWEEMRRLSEQLLRQVQQIRMRERAALAEQRRLEDGR